MIALPKNQPRHENISYRRIFSFFSGRLANSVTAPTSTKPNEMSQGMVRFKSDDAIWQAPLMVALAIASVAPAFAATLEIAVTGVRDGNGWLDVCVFNSAKGFPNCGEDRSILSRRLPASPGTTRIDVDVAPGVHAVSVLHDENGNGQLDTNFLGMPREGGGVSNNPPPQMHPPRFADAVFDVPLNGGQIIIKMVYP